MRCSKQHRIVTALALGCILTWIAGCASTPPVAAPVKPPEAVHAMADVQKLLEKHPSRSKLRQMEQEMAAIEAKTADNSAAQDTAGREFEAAMKVRQNEDKAAIEKKQAQLGDELSEQRRLFIEALETEFRSSLFNIDLKLKTVQQPPAQMQALQAEKAQLEAQRQQKLAAKEEELAARFKSEMTAFAAEISKQSEAYANQWMSERVQRMQKDAVSPEREKLVQEIRTLTAKMVQDVKEAVAKVAAQEKIEVVWVRQAVHQPLKDITETVEREVANIK